MGNRQNTIEINGKKYDTKTGRLLSNAPKPSQGKNVDGFIKRTGKKTPSATVHTSTQRAKTLMRTVVKKPHIGSLAATAVETQPTIEIHDDLDAKRLIRAKKIAKSRLVSRFGRPSFSDFSIRPKHTSLPVKAPPSEIKPETATPKPSKHQSTIQESLEKADSHKLERLKKPGLRHRTASKLKLSPKKLNIRLGVLAAVLLIGFITNQNIPNITVRVASARAGVDASLPGYLPAGFSMHGRVAYRPGEITIGYKSNSDQRSFEVKQTISSWDSQALLENFVATNQKPFQTYQDNGKTIYIYDNSNATWVDRGIWYQIEGTSSLNSDQLLRLANSI